MEKGNFKLSSSAWWLFLLPTLLLAFYRSVELDITNDEAYSFKLVAELTRHFVPARNLMYGTANTHWLNSFFIFIEHHLLGDQVWMIRLHNVFALVLLFYAFYLLAKKEQSFLLFVLCCIFIPFNHYLFDFFSLARGYGLSLALEALAIAYIITDAKHYRQRIYVLLSLGVLANYTLIYGLLVYGLLDLFYEWKEHGWRVFIQSVFYRNRWAPMLLLLWAIPNIYYIKYISCDLEEGQRNGFITDTLGVFLGRSWDVLSYPATIAIGFIWLASITLFYVFKRKGISEGWKKIMLSTFLIILFIHVLYYGLHIPFPFGRTSFFLIVPLLLLLAFVVHQLMVPLSNPIQISLLSVLFLANFLYIFNYRNLRSTLEWWMQQGMHEFVTDSYQTIGSSVKTASISMSIDHWGVYHNYYQFIYPKQTFDSVFVYDRFGYDVLSVEEKENMLRSDYLLLINNYTSFLQSNWKKPLPQVLKQYPDMKSDWLKK
ncbi:MAG: hypothetical protein JNM95_01095 [Chitinophagaceae bacterium]|nr:hypothetical protein [Chitinophagaceae bacterium]